MNNQNEDSIHNTPKTDIKYNKIHKECTHNALPKVKNRPQEKKNTWAIKIPSK
jgi:hypothetical protein